MRFIWDTSLLLCAWIYAQHFAPGSEWAVSGGMMAYNVIGYYERIVQE